jgi:hypothetical protein
MKDITSERKAAIVVGIGLIVTLFLTFLVDDFILPNFIRPGDTETLERDIQNNNMLFQIAIVGYLIVLASDTTTALALYILLKQANKNLASLMAVLRLLYVVIIVISIIALAFLIIDVYSYETIKLIGYLFFIGHLFVTGYVVFKSGYIPRVLGVLLIVASFCYIPVFYINFFDEALLLIFVVCMVIGEISLYIWLLLKNSKISEMIEETRIINNRNNNHKN